MFDRLRNIVLRIMRVPPEPEPPFGAPGSIRIFRAGRNYYKLRLVTWMIGQVGAAIGIIVSLGFLAHFESTAENARTLRAEAARAKAEAAAAAASESNIDPPGATEPSATRKKGPRNRRNNLNAIAARTPPWAFSLMQIVEAGAVLLFLIQIPFTYAMVRLEFEQHWYIVTDRSLRIRTGLVALQESTMSYANLQQVQVKQGPLQRLLGLANVEVQSAGGGGEKTEMHGTSLHTGVFHGVENASEIRDLILDRLRLFRQAGLGDPDDSHTTHDTGTSATNDHADAAIAAAKELLAEARALRSAV